jgi:ABC-type antimicrobial peptide transport system permease subunit
VEALARIDPNLTLVSRPLVDLVDGLLIQEHLLAVLSGFFGGLALLLGALGLYGVTAYAVSRRRSEIGVRLALGATRGRVVRLMFSGVAIPIGGGIMIGVGISLWAATFVRTLLYGLQPGDAPTLIGATLLLAAVGSLAAFVPAWGASRIDPVIVLREQ